MSNGDRETTLKRMRHVSTAKSGDRVRVYGFAEWLKGEPMIAADITPREARQLAIRLLTAADLVDDRCQP